AGELKLMADGNDMALSDPSDTARSVARSMIATEDPNDKGVWNNWHKASEIKPQVEKKLLGSQIGKTMYVVAGLMEYGKVGVQLTDSRYGVLNMADLNPIGKVAWDALGESKDFLKIVHSTGNLKKIRRARPGHEHEDPDDRAFVYFPE